MSRTLSSYYIIPFHNISSPGRRPPLLVLLLMDPLVVVSQLATGLGVLAGAMLVKSATERPMARPGQWRPPPCATCNGTGRVPCLCARWSDGDVGCRTCAWSGRKICSSCGGSGTGRPVPIRLNLRSNR